MQLKRQYNSLWMRQCKYQVVRIGYWRSCTITPNDMLIKKTFRCAFKYATDTEVRYLVWKILRLDGPETGSIMIMIKKCVLLRKKMVPFYCYNFGSLCASHKLKLLHRLISQVRVESPRTGPVERRFGLHALPPAQILGFGACFYYFWAFRILTAFLRLK